MPSHPWYCNHIVELIELTMTRDIGPANRKMISKADLQLFVWHCATPASEIFPFDYDLPVLKENSKWDNVD